ncbi:RES family NAD+ phosphorylase [Bradyrhizobium sp. AS23.2]|uniref:RES family NAD+ phosphorylase n=1 Tax=Bradyrhizobium sp. AS23.2 TaxID=1680155 RepID=UPI00093EF55E|nr:RES family NAD+ phosphorylase [Bradyrhizobium sp. AS23.2]OKO70759.1 RES domain protein [Bradyrhizobium sp. AS23.2]
MSDSPSVVRVHWPTAFRIIRSIFSPIDLFEDIADPSDWEALASIESKTNPRIWEQIGRLELVPPARRVVGQGASYLMAPFVHISTERPGRFTDGTYGVYSAGDREEVAIRETAHHHDRAMANSKEEPGWTSQFRVLINRVDLDLHDLRGRGELHEASDYATPQAFARQLRSTGSNGILYRSVRCSDGECVAIFWPDLIPIPVQGDHYEYHWDGSRVDKVRNSRTGAIFAL